MKEIRPKDAVLVLRTTAREETVPNDAVFTMIGREPPLAFLRRSGVRIRGEWTAGDVGRAPAASWRSARSSTTGRPEASSTGRSQEHDAFPFGVPAALGALAAAFARPANVLGTIALSAGSPGFYYSLAYCLCVLDLRDQAHPKAQDAVRHGADRHV